MVKCADAEPTVHTHHGTLGRCVSLLGCCNQTPAGRRLPQQNFSFCRSGSGESKAEVSADTLGLWMSAPSWVLTRSFLCAHILAHLCVPGS